MLSVESNVYLLYVISGADSRYHAVCTCLLNFYLIFHNSFNS